MSILDCIKNTVKNTKLVDEITEEYENILRETGGDTVEADGKLAEWWAEYRGEYKSSRLRHALAAHKVDTMVIDTLDQLMEEWGKLGPKAQAVARFFGYEPNHSMAVQKMFNYAKLSAEAHSKNLLGELGELYSSAAPKGLMLDSDRSLMNSVVTGMIDGVETMADSQAKLVAQELRNMFQKSLKEYRGVGGLIGKIENYVPIKHNAMKIGQVDFETWFADYRSMTDISKVRDFRNGKRVSEARFKEIAENMYDDITTNNTSRAKRAGERARSADRRIATGKVQQADLKKRIKEADEIEAADLNDELRRLNAELKRARADRAGATGKITNPHMHARRMQSRLSTPVSSKAFHDYNQKYGVGDEGMFDLMVSALDTIGRDTGVMRVLGPMPESVRDGLVAQGKEMGVHAIHTATTEAMYRTLVGHWNGSVDGILANGANVLHHIASAALLGSAPVSALADSALIASAKRLNGLTGGGAGVAEALGAMVGDAPSLLRSMHIYEALSHTNVNRFDGSTGMTAGGWLLPKMNNFKNMNHRLSGLQAITNATGDILSVTFFGDLGMYVQKGFAFGSDDIPEAFTRMLKRNHVTEQDWDALLAHGVDARGFITPQGLSDDLAAVSYKLDNINVELRQFATNSPDLHTQNMSTGNWAGERVRGDLQHIMSSLVMQFKSFPVQVWKNHFVPSLSQGMKGGGWTPMSLLVMQSAFLGIGIVQLKEMIKGKATLEWDDPNLYLRGLWQAGFMGLLGDVLLKDPEAYKRNLISEMAGPVPSMTADLALTTMANIKNGFLTGDDGNFDWAAQTRAMRSFVPLSSIWYLRTAIDRIGMDALNSMDPDYYSTMQRQNKAMRKERGSDGWWAKGDTIPQF